MKDIIEKYGKSLIQHGKCSNRVYLIKLFSEDFPGILDWMDDLARTNKYSKIFVKVPDWAKEEFICVGYRAEAYIPAFYEGKGGVSFMAKYPDPQRMEEPNVPLIEEIIAAARRTPLLQGGQELPKGYRYDILEPKDIPDMTEVYRKVFETYPFPIHNPDYLAAAIKEHTVYFGIRDEGELAAIASCEMDEESKNVEMTDFATLPRYRAKGLASFLLAKMEEEMKKRGILTAYTIARAVSFGMNITFAKHNYTFSGTLINNTNISGGIESMNVWYKRL